MAVPVPILKSALSAVRAGGEGVEKKRTPEYKTSMECPGHGAERLTEGGSYQILQVAFSKGPGARADKRGTWGSSGPWHMGGPHSSTPSLTLSFLCAFTGHAPKLPLCSVLTLWPTLSWGPWPVLKVGEPVCLGPKETHRCRTQGDGHTPLSPMTQSYMPSTYLQFPIPGLRPSAPATARDRTRGHKSCASGESLPTLRNTPF